MIKEFKDVLRDESYLYLGEQKSIRKKMKQKHHKRYFIWKYLYYFRLCQYYSLLRQDSNIFVLQRILAKYLFRFCEKKKNDYSYMSGVEIGLQCKIGKNCNIWHSGVVINGNLGDNCTLHGNNIIGNKGKGKENHFPVLGSNVDIGAGAVLIGEIKVADNSVIGAGAVVTKSFLQSGSTIVGVPGKLMNT